MVEAFPVVLGHESKGTKQRPAEVVEVSVTVVRIGTRDYTRIVGRALAATLGHIPVMITRVKVCSVRQKNRKHSDSAGTSAKAKLFARWRHHLRFTSGSRMPPLTQ